MERAKKGTKTVLGIQRDIIEALKENYPAGTRVELVEMRDPYTKLRPGDKGTVNFVDDIGTIHVDWDNGSSLGVVYKEDRIVYANDNQ